MVKVLSFGIFAVKVLLTVFVNIAPFKGIAQSGTVVPPSLREPLGTIEIGKPAPPFKVIRFVKGGSFDTLAKGNIYVVELTQIHCSACVKCIPHLSEMSKKLAGKAQFVSVYVSENDPDSPDTSYINSVRSFVRQIKTPIHFPVAVDVPEQYMYRRWLRAVKLAGTPTVFVVNRQGNISWIGGALTDTLEGVINEVVKSDRVFLINGNSPSVTDRALREASKKNYHEALHILDSAIDIAGNNEGILFSRKMQVLADFDEDSAYRYARTFLTVKSYWNVGDDLASLAAMIRYKYQMGVLKHPDWSLAISLIERAKIEHQKQSVQLVYADFIFAANIYSVMGDFDNAAISQKQAIDYMKKYSPEEYNSSKGQKLVQDFEKYQKQAKGKTE